MVALAAEAAERGAVEFKKDDAVFVCRGPRASRLERARAAGPRHCASCGNLLQARKIEGKVRALCMRCGAIAYENPLPVAAAVVTNERGEVLLVRRARHPLKGMWCLPCGFAEKDEQIEGAALRELREETHLRGRVVRLLDAVTARNYFYGNLVMITFEVGGISGTPSAGDDAAEVCFFPPDRLPPLAFPCQEQAIRRNANLPDPA
jgi:ADP-ribose pyrophosphatase YjhB (NUDIX family)